MRHSTSPSESTVPLLLLLMTMMMMTMIVLLLAVLPVRHRATADAAAVAAASGERPRAGAPPAQGAQSDEPLLHLAVVPLPSQVQRRVPGGALQVQKVAVGRMAGVDRPAHDQLGRA